MKYFLLFFLWIGAVHINAQEIMFSSGINYTKYIYKNSLGESNKNVNPGTGNFYEMSYQRKFTKKSKFKYAAGVALNEFNATGGNLVSVYNWKSSYLGLKTGISYDVINTKSGLNIALNMGVNGNTIIKGEQLINGLSFDLTKEPEFKGYFLQSMAGVDFLYAVTKKTVIGVGYNYSKNLKISVRTDEVLEFQNNQLQFKLQFKI